MKKEGLSFEEALAGAWTDESNVIEVPLPPRTLALSGVAVVGAGIVVLGQIFFLGARAPQYSARAAVNMSAHKEIPAPRGVIVDRFGKVLAENEPSFLLALDTGKFLTDPDTELRVLHAAEQILKLSPDSVWQRIREADLGARSGTVVLSEGIGRDELRALKALSEPAFSFEEGFKRKYPQGPALSTVVGYTGLVNARDLKNDPALGYHATVGRAGLEAQYDSRLRGTPGSVIHVRDARGMPRTEPETTPPSFGEILETTIDSEFQDYFYSRLTEGLRALQRTTGVGIAMNPQNGEILALFSVPSADNNVFSSSGNPEEKRELLRSPLEPLFNRAIGGAYNPGSTIKPLVAVAALSEGVISPDRRVFSPGYLDIPNPYRPQEPTRYLDWRFQGSVDLSAAIAQSSNVYFYLVGGGSPNNSPDVAYYPENAGIRGLGVERLRTWWKEFLLGVPSGIDLPGEAEGFLPDPRERERASGNPWLLGDTYNVSIGQGDLLVTPIQLLSYVNAIANKGFLLEPFIRARGQEPVVRKDLSELRAEFLEVEHGMREAVTSPRGTAGTLLNLPFPVYAKTGSAQVRNNTEENAFFVGYASAREGDPPSIAILVLVENSREGSLNALPIARDALNWYYEHRLK
ncbi:MAG: hypothetical protein HY435_01915 [Candidatus Liptonbacteria bacterium]|nr:hypothetical protein [Candidatus Liptonbacteria bacterium]